MEGYSRALPTHDGIQGPPGKKKNSDPAEVEKQFPNINS